MLAHISAEQHGFVDHPMMYAAGIEQMQTVCMPRRQSDVSGVKSFLVGDDDNDVAVVNRRPEELVVRNLVFRDVSVAFTCNASFHGLDACHPLGMSCEHLVVGGMCAHPVDSHFLNSCEGRIGMYVGHDALLLVVVDPHREIMLTSGVLHLSANIPHLF